MNFFVSLENFLFNAPRWKVLGSLAIAAVAKAGVWFPPNLDSYRALALNPFDNPYKELQAQYLFWNWLGPFLAWLTGATEKAPFLILHLAFAVAYVSLLLWLLFTRLPEEAARTAAFIFLLLPVSMTAFYWIGMDGLILFLLTCFFVKPERLWLSLILGLLLGLEHFEQGLFAAGALILSILIANRDASTGKGVLASQVSLKAAVVFLAGVLCGKAVLIAIVGIFDIDVSSGRADWLSHHLSDLLAQFAGHFQLILWSALGLGWLVALRFASEQKAARAFLLPFGGLLCLLPIVADQTKVIANISFPLILNYWLLNRGFLVRITRPEITLLVLIWLLLPWQWVWEGVQRPSVFSYDLFVLAHHLFGLFELPAYPNWPFE